MERQRSSSDKPPYEASEEAFKVTSGWFAPVTQEVWFVVVLGLLALAWEVVRG
jgi:hypothetical protein